MFDKTETKTVAYGFIDCFALFYALRYFRLLEME